LKSKELKDVKDYSGTVYVNDVTAPTIAKSEFQANGDLVVTFSEPLSAVDPIVRVAGKPVNFASVSLGDTSITLTAANLAAAGVSVSGGQTATVYVAGAKDTVGNEMAIFNGTATKGTDSEKPFVTSVTQLGQNKLKVVFSEALGASASDLAIGEFKFLKGSTVYSSTGVTKDTNDASGKTYEVEFTETDIYGSSNPVDAQTVTLLLDANAVKDAYGNGNVAISQAFTFNTDKTAPKFVSSKVADDKQTLELTFDEAFVGTTAAVDESKIIITDADGVRYNALDATTVVKAGASNTKVLVVDFVAGATAIENGTYTVTVQAGAIKDTKNNSNAAFTTSVTVGDASDSTKPVATLDTTSTDAPISSENVFVVDYSEEVGSSALNTANYKLDGSALPAGTVVYFNSTAKNSVTIELPENVYNIGTVGTGTDALLNVSGVADKAGNTVDSTNLTVEVSDNTSAKLQAVQVVGNDILLTFDEAIDSTTATNIDTVAELAAQFEIKVDGDALNLGTDDSTATGGSDAAVAVSLVAGNAKQVKVSLTPAVVGTGGTVAGDGVASNWNPTKPVTVKVKEATLKDANLYTVKAGTVISK
jgi:trimeric autotransporter adhesin